MHVYTYDAQAFAQTKQDLFRKYFTKNLDNSKLNFIFAKVQKVEQDL